MKKNLTLFAILCLVSAFAFGQSETTPKKATTSHMDFKAREAHYQQIKNSATKAPKSLVLKQDSIVEQVFDTTSNLWVYECQSKMTYDNQGRNNYVFMQNWDVAQNKWVDAAKEYLKFDNNNNITNYLTLEWNGTDNRWDSSYKNASIYNSNNLITLYNSYNWDSSTNLWKNKYQTVVHYNANNLDTCRIESSWNSDSAKWNIDSKYVKEYDANSNLITQLRYGWNSSINQLDTSNLIRYFYDLSNKKTRRESYSRQSGIIKLMETNYYTYNSNQLLSLDSNIMSGGSPYMIYYTYDANSHLLEELRTYFDGTKNVNSDKTNYTYNALGKITNEDEYSWENDAWSKHYKYERSFDNNGNLVNFMSGGYYNMANGNYFTELQSGNRQVLMYDLSYNANQIALNNEEDIEGNKMDTTTWEAYNYTNVSWYYTQKTIYYYSAYSANGISENVASGITIYPNPAKDYIMIDSKEVLNNASIMIYDTFGRLVMNQPIQGKVSVQNLSKGLYMYNINNNGQILSGKLIVE